MLAGRVPICMDQFNHRNCWTPICGVDDQSIIERRFDTGLGLPSEEVCYRFIRFYLFVLDSAVLTCDDITFDHNLIARLLLGHFTTSGAVSPLSDARIVCSKQLIYVL